MSRARFLSVARFRPQNEMRTLPLKKLAQRRHRASTNSNNVFISGLKLKSGSDGQGWPYVSNPRRWTDDKTFMYPGTNQDMVVAIKDSFTSKELPTTCASLMLDGFTTPYSSSVGTLLKNDGFRLLGKTNMDEFGMGSHSLNSAWGPITQPTKTSSLSVGGSSGGSALAVARRFVQAAIGSDTGGSVRLPAAYTNTVGFKPSYGRVSRNGLIPYANSLDTVGIIADSVYHAALLYKIFDRPDYHDPTCLSTTSRARIQAVHQNTPGSHRNFRGLHGELDIPPPEYTLKAASTTYKPRIGVPSEYMIDELHPLVRKAWQRLLAQLRQTGNHVVPISLPTTKMALAAYYIIAPAEASSNLAKYDGVRYGASRSAQADDEGGTLYAQHRGEKFGEEVKRRILLGTFSLSATAMDNYFIQAQKIRRLVQDDFNKAFFMTHPLRQEYTGGDGVDFIIVPTAPNIPPTISELSRQSPLDSYMNDVFTVPASLAGLPAISIPAIYDEDVPLSRSAAIGMQIIGQYGDDYSVLNFALNQVETLMKNMPPVKTEGTRGLI